MPQVLWKGSITFGLVNIPVALHTAESRDRFDFDLIDRRDHSPVGYLKINKRTGKEVTKADIVKGYEYKDGEYVLVEDEDFRRASVEKTQTIEIVNFVPAKKISPVYYDRPYYLEPINRSEKGYAILREALAKSGKAGIAKLVIRYREHIAALLVDGPVLILNLLRYAHELREPKNLKIPGEAKKFGVGSKEISLAERLIEDMTGNWDPGKFHDTYREDLLAFIKEKAKRGKTAEVEALPPKTREAGRPVDIMALLKKSVDRVEAGHGSGNGHRGNGHAHRSNGSKRVRSKT